MMFCNPDHRSSHGSGRAHRAKAKGGGQRPGSRPTPPPGAAAGRPGSRSADANGRPRQGGRASRARQREGQREDSQHAPPDGWAPLYPVPPPAGWITAVAGSSAAAGAMAATRIAMP